jgi:hypothetical protein
MGKFAGAIAHRIFPKAGMFPSVRANGRGEGPT